MGVNVNLDGGVHANDAQAADDLGRVADLLRAEQELVVVRLPVVVEALEALGREADRRGRGELEAARVKEVQEGVLDDLGPDLEVPKVGLGQSANDGVGNVANARLDGKKRLGHAAVLDLVLKELDEVRGNGCRGGVCRRIGQRLVLVVGLDDADHLFRVNGHGCAADSVLNPRDQVRLAVRGEICQSNVVKSIETRQRSIDLDDDLVLVLAKEAYGISQTRSFLPCRPFE